jgi:hypothetical protein
MAKHHYLKIFLRDQPDYMLLPVRDDVVDRLQRLLDGCQSAPPPKTTFFWFDTTDGKSITLNLRYLQAVHYLWEAAAYAQDDVRSEEGINILFAGRQEPLELNTDVPEQLYDFFMHLDHGPEVVPYPAFQDEDGETIQVNPHEVVWVTAPKDLLQEGEEVVMNELKKQSAEE